MLFSERRIIENTVIRYLVNILLQYFLRFFYRRVCIKFTTFIKFC